MTRLIGRQAELAELRRLLASSRLLTITGPAGIGKTRLAVELAAGRDPDIPTYFVDLAVVSPAVDPDQLISVICGAVGIRDASREQGLPRLAAHLDGPAVMLLLDNCGHVMKSGGPVIDSLLRRCPALQILATSREPLRVEGETTYLLAPLPLTGGDAADIPSGDAAILFMDRMQGAGRGLPPNTADLPAVDAICRCVGGLPLSIELAASRAGDAGLAGVATRLANSPSEVTTASTDLQRKRRWNLAEVIRWSYDLLSADEAALYRRISVFAGRFDLRGAALVSGSLPAGGTHADALLRLVELSFVTPAVSPNRAPQYRLLPPLRSYAWDWLLESGEADRTVTAHLEAVTELAESLLDAAAGPESAANLDRLEIDLPTITAALGTARQAQTELRDGAVGHHDPANGTPEAAAHRIALGVRLASALTRWCYLRGHYVRGRAWLEWAVAAGRPGPRPPLARALAGAGWMAFLQCDYPIAAERLSEALDLFSALDDGPNVIETLLAMGGVARETNDYQQAEALYGRARKLATIAGDEWRALRADNYLGFLAWLQGRFAEAIERCTAAGLKARALADAEASIWSAMNVGVASAYLGRSDVAKRMLTQALQQSIQAHFPEGIAWAHHMSGFAELRHGGAEDRLAAGTQLLQALTDHRMLGDRWRMASVLDTLAALAASGADGIAAARLLGAAEALRDEIGSAPAPCEAFDRRATQRIARSLLRGRGLDAELAAGRDADLDDLVRLLGFTPRAGDPPPVVDPPPTALQGSAESQPAPVAPMVRVLDIRMLGASAVRVDGRLLRGTDFGYAKPRELLFLLATRGPQTKEEIGATLWPASSEGHVRGALHTALRELRRALGSATAIGFVEGRYLIHPDITVTSDLARFQAESADADSAVGRREALPRLRRAVAAYHGNYLADAQTGVGHSSHGSWVEETAANLRRRFHGLLVRTGRLLLGEHRWAAAAEMFLLAVHDDPSDERARRLLLTAWAGGTTRRVSAIQRRWITDLARDPTTEPTPEDSDGSLAEEISENRVTTDAGGALLYERLVERRRSFADA
jgi:predicted ATPase/DNA-binding SARP family transcriptional activator